MATFLGMEQIVVVGAGPVGMTVAALCAKQGAVPTLVERRVERPEGSRAIGVTPASLEILGRIGLTTAMLERGVQVRSAYVHNEHRALGHLRFSEISGRHPYILVLPQVDTEELLLRYLSRNGVVVHEGWSVKHLSEAVTHQESVRLNLRRAGSGIPLGTSPGYSEVSHVSEVSASSDVAELQSEYVVCADGFRGSLAAQLGLATQPNYMPYHFVMGDFHDRSSLGADAHLWFTNSGAVESFPLPGRKRRWIAQLSTDSAKNLSSSDAKDADSILAMLEQLVHERTGFSLRSEDCSWRSSFQPVKRIAVGAAVGRCFLAGDALHAMSPIGGQGMNSGIADAELLSELLTSLLRASNAAQSSNAGAGILSLDQARKVYTKARLRAGSSAASRAGIGTHIGSLRGRIGSGLRSTLIQAALNSPLQKHIASHFAMRTIPYRRAMHVLSGSSVRET
ncbi:MAG: FAD-dependent monooxygenase [Spirochaetaceae bacterium]|nr:MAG: FAD-dependent monooxygenase [Spirochaetaceae bacterium]